MIFSPNKPKQFFFGLGWENPYDLEISRKKIAYRFAYGSNLTTRLGIFQKLPFCWETPRESSKVVTFCNLVVLTLLLDGRSNWWLVRIFLGGVGGLGRVGWRECAFVSLLFVCLFTRSSRRHRFYHNKDWEDSCPFDLSSVCFVCFFGRGVELKCFHQTKSSCPQKHAQQRKQWRNTLPQTKIAPENGWFFKTTSTFLLGQKGLFSGTTLVSGMKQQRVYWGSRAISCVACMLSSVSGAPNRCVNRAGHFRKS